MRVAVDLDDVVVEFSQGVLDAIATETGVYIPLDNLTDWYFGQFGLDDALGEDWWSWLERRDWVWATFKPVPGAINAVDRLRKAGHYIELLTSKPPWAEWCVWKWLGRWRPAFQRVTIVPNGETKSTASEADVLIDDRIENCDEWVLSRSYRSALLYERPWNRKASVESDVSRAYGWGGILEHFGVLEAK